MLILEITIVTTVVAVGVTLYWPARRGHYFQSLQPSVARSFLVLLVYCIIQVNRTGAFLYNLSCINHSTFKTDLILPILVSKAMFLSMTAADLLPTREDSEYV